MSVLVIVFLTAIFTLFGGGSNGSRAKGIAILGLFVAFGISFIPEFSLWEAYQNMFKYDAGASLFTKISILITIFIFFLGDFALYHHHKHQPEMYAMTLFSLCGALVLFGMQNMTTLFLGIEILSIPLYVLAGSEKKNLFSVEASVKYFLMGAFATGFLLFGITLVYGSVGSLDLMKIALFSQESEAQTMFVLGILLILGALAFKVALVPFHLWSPDVYYGSPTCVTLFMASVVKIAGFYAFFSLMNTAFIGNREEWIPILLGIISITLILGSILGLVQTDVKRLMAYSSIVNAGYMGLIFFGIGEESSEFLAFYSWVYSLSTIGVFMVIIWVEKCKGGTYLENFNGLAKQHPILALTMAISVFSLAGIPFTAGFIGKLNLFLYAIEESIFLIILAVLASVVSIGYYLKIIMAMYFQKEERKDVLPKPNLTYKIIAILIIIMTLILGIFPHLFSNFNKILY